MRRGLPRAHGTTAPWLEWSAPCDAGGEKIQYILPMLNRSTATTATSIQPAIRAPTLLSATAQSTPVAATTKINDRHAPPTTAPPFEVTMASIWEPAYGELAAMLCARFVSAPDVASSATTAPPIAQPSAYRLVT